MENATNALLMAGAVLIGIMILSAGVYLFVQFSNTSSQISAQLSETQISQFNSQFTKFEGKSDITAHDIVSISNLAKQNNEEYYENSGRRTDPYYIEVILKNSGSFNSTEFEKKDETFYQDFIKNNDVEGTTKITFTCTGVEINESTRLVKRITFTKN